VDHCPLDATIQSIPHPPDSPPIKSFLRPVLYLPYKKKKKFLMLLIQGSRKRERLRKESFNLWGTAV